MAFQTRTELQNQTLGWLRKGCSSLGGGTAVQLPRIWMSSGECRLKSPLNLTKNWGVGMYRLFGVAFITLVLVALLAPPLPAGTLADSDDVSVVSFATPKMGRADGAEIKGLLFKPNGEGPFPALIALHGAGGIFPYQLDWARFLRENGYVVLFVDSYCARGFICEHESGDDHARPGEIRRDWQQV